MLFRGKKVLILKKRRIQIMIDAIALFFAAAIVAGTPLLFAILGEIITEKSGKLNLGVEGMMLMGAVMGFKIGLDTGNPLLAVAGAGIAGGLGALIFAFLTITLRANQVVTGLTLTIFGTGFASFIGKDLVGEVAPQAIKDFFIKIEIPLLSDIPFFGQILFNQDIFIYFGYVSAIFFAIYLYKTKLGLNLKAIGENAAAADASGLNVNLYRYIHVLIGGVYCGLAGGYLSLVYIPAWQENVTAGRGWIAVALVIFSQWNPIKAFFAAIVFGGLDIIGFRLQGYYINISQYLIDMLPYLVTTAVLILVSIKKTKENKSPADLGVPYFREDR